MEIIKLEQRTLTDAHFSQLVEIEKNCGLEPYTPEMLRECIADLDTYAAIDNERVAGFVTVHPGTRYLNGGLYIVNLNVAKEYRRQGLAKLLMVTACAQYGNHAGRIVTLDVAKNNIAALNLYLGLGFEITDLPSGNGDTDHVMIAKLDTLLGVKKTKRLSLRPISLGDAIALGDILLNNTVKKTYMVPDLSLADAQKLGHKMAMLSCNKKRYVRGIYLKDTLVGFLNDVEISDGSIELGWVVAPEHQGNGYAAEAVHAAIEDLFDLGYTQVVAGAFVDNTASIRVMEKAGMALQDKTEEIEYRGQFHKCVYYAVKKEMPL